MLYYANKLLRLVHAGRFSKKAVPFLYKFTHTS